MNCTHYKKMIYLYGEGELTSSQNTELEAHISGCESCRREQENAIFLKQKTDSIKNTIPYISNEEAFTDELMNNIIKEKVKSGDYNSLLNRIIIILSKKQLRLGLVSLLVFISFSFIYESTITLSGISTLEKKTEFYSSREMKASVFIDADLLKSLKELYNLYNGDQQFADLSADLMIIKKESFRKYLLLYSRIDDLSSELPAEFEKEYPELYRFIKESAQSDKLAFDPENKKLLNEFEKILNKGDKK